MDKGQDENTDHGAEFLVEKYPDLAGSDPIEHAVQKEIREGEKGPANKEERVDAYLDRLERLVLDPKKEQDRKLFDGEPRPRALSLLREKVMNEYVRPHKEKMAQGAARVEERAAREMGIEARYGEQELEQRGDIAVKDVERSLDNWISYLSDANEPYPAWFRYYAFRNILNLGDYDKDKQEFTKRSPGSVRLFPDIDRGALAYVEQMMEAAKDHDMLERLQKAQQAAANQDIPAGELITEEKAEAFSKRSFAKQYAEGIKQAGEITPEMREETRGTWVKYQRGTDPTALWASLQNKGVAWCTKGFATAETQLKGGDFYVYYTRDQQGNPTIPRIAIRMQEDRIGEVRGAADNEQNLEGNMADIAKGKMSELPGRERYEKASSDMKQLTVIEKKTKEREPLTKEDLTFLYELDGTIEGFGYQRDPRIKELRDQRNPEEDMPIIFACTKEQIAHTPEEITKDTKAYVGKLEPGIFRLTQHYGIEHIHTSFPEGRIRKEELDTAPITLKEFEHMADAHNKTVADESLKLKISDYAKDMLKRAERDMGAHPERLALVRLRVQDLFPYGNAHTIKEIYDRAEALGLALCPPETGPRYRLARTSQPNGEWVSIAMQQIPDRDGNPDVFDVLRNDDGLWLNGYWTNPADARVPRGECLFSFRKLKNSDA